MIKQFVLVGLGGALGSMLRYATSLLTSKHITSAFPLATFITNILGCFLIGLFISYFSKTSNQQLQLLLITGFCGGYTTFSTFSAENIALWQSQHYFSVIIYTLGSVLIGFLAVWLGVLINR